MSELYLLACVVGLYVCSEVSPLSDWGILEHSSGNNILMLT